MPFDMNAMGTFLKGYTEEQDRQASEKKINAALKDKNAQVSMRTDPVSGKPTYSVQYIDPQKQQQEQQLRAAQIKAAQQRAQTIEEERNKPVIRNVGRSLIKYDPQTGEMENLYDAPSEKQVLDTPRGFYLIDKQTGEMEQLTDAAGRFVGKGGTKPDGDKWIKVKRKSDGRVGEVLESDINKNPGKYERQ